MSCSLGCRVCTDQFGKGVSVARAREVLPKLDNQYEHAYCAGIISERWAESLLRQGRSLSSSFPWRIANTNACRYCLRIDRECSGAGICGCALG